MHLPSLNEFAIMELFALPATAVAWEKCSEGSLNCNLTVVSGDSEERDEYEAQHNLLSEVALMTLSVRSTRIALERLQA